MMHTNIYQKLNKLLQNTGVQADAIRIEITDSQIPAQAKGACLYGIPAGCIFISKTFLNKLTEDELDFTLAHELSHILLNHQPKSVVLELPKTILNSINESWSKIAKSSIDLIKLLTVISGNLPPKEAAIKNQEIEADINAIYITKNKAAAITLINKLNNITHTSEIAGKEFPILYADERISAINKLNL